MEEITLDVFRDHFLTGKIIKIYLQPIIQLSSNSIVGYEALARGIWRGEIISAELLFEFAEKFNLTNDLELTCLRKALTIIPDIPDGWLSVNIGPNLLISSQLLSEINQIPEKFLNKLVLELTEHVPINLSNELFYSISALRERGIKLSLDDAGCGFMSFELARILKPDFVKLCIIFLKEEFFIDRMKKRLKNVVNELTKWGITIIAEGAENEKQIQLLRALNIKYAQGFYFSRPLPAKEILHKNTH